MASKNRPIRLTQERGEQVARLISTVCGLEISVAREFVEMSKERYNMNAICSACRIGEDSVFYLADDAFWSCVAGYFVTGLIEAAVRGSDEAAAAWAPFAKDQPQT